MDSDEQIIENLIRKRGLRAKEFSRIEKGKSKTPDFRVFKENELIFFCEVKAISHDEWPERLVSAAPPGKIVGGGRNDPAFNRISSKIHEAVQQFEAVNPNWELPNVLAFVNHDDICGWLDLVAVTTGCFLSKGGGIHPIYLKYSEGRIKTEKFHIDLYIWIDEFKGDLYLFNLVDKKHLNKLCSYFDKDPRSVKNILTLHRQQKL